MARSLKMSRPIEDHKFQVKILPMTDLSFGENEKFTREFLVMT